MIGLSTSFDISPCSYSALKAQLLEVDTDFNDHVQARQKIINELKQETNALAQAKDQ